MQGKASANILEAAIIPAGTTVLDAVLGMGSNVTRLFVVGPNYPSDLPIQNNEYAIDVIRQQGGGRILVIAWEYSGNLVSVRQIFANKWNASWKTVSLTTQS